MLNLRVKCKLFIYFLFLLHVLIIRNKELSFLHINNLHLIILIWFLLANCFFFINIHLIRLFHIVIVSIHIWDKIILWLFICDAAIAEIVHHWVIRFLGLIFIEIYLVLVGICWWIVLMVCMGLVLWNLIAYMIVWVWGVGWQWRLF